MPPGLWIFSKPSQAAFGIQLPRGGLLQERETFREDDGEGSYLPMGTGEAYQMSRA